LEPSELDLGLGGHIGVGRLVRPLGATDEAGRFLILVLFASNIVLHMLWSPLFFALKRPDWALAEVPFLWLSIVTLMFGIGRYSTLAICRRVAAIIDNVSNHEQRT
jgi:hypothetical protein